MNTTPIASESELAVSGDLPTDVVGVGSGPDADPDEVERSPFSRVAKNVENFFALGFLAILAILPIAELSIRSLFRGSIPSFAAYLNHTVFLVACLGSAITSRRSEHLSMSLGTERLPRPWSTIAINVSGFFNVLVTSILVISSLSFALVAFGPRESVGVFPIQLVVLVFPVSFLLILIRFVWPRRHRPFLAVSVVAIAASLVFTVPVSTNIMYAAEFPIPGFWADVEMAWFQFIPKITPVFVIGLIASAVVGTPIFVVLAGAALFLFAGQGGALEVVPGEGYTMLTGTFIPAIALFTVSGFLLSESGAGSRLVRVFRALFGWLPGGLAIAAVLVSTFFTTFTGTGGVTILALGGLLLLVLTESGGYPPGFSRGLLTGSGSLGLLFPPSLAIILYGSIVQISIFDLFAASIIPGVIMVAAMSAIGVWYSVKYRIGRTRFDGRDALKAVWASSGELLMPVVVVGVYFSGIATLVETSSIAVVYAFVLEVLIRREVTGRRLVSVGVRSIAIVGGVLVILGVARGLSYFVIDAQVPQMLAAGVEETIRSPIVFLLLLNVALLVTGCFMDIFSAISVVAPLLVPLGVLFGIHPAHLGVIFIANLGIGFITPPVGLNLFLASYRFGRPLTQLYRDVLPFFLVQIGIVLVITFVPFFSTALLGG